MNGLNYMISNIIARFKAKVNTDVAFHEQKQKILNDIELAKLQQKLERIKSSDSPLEHTWKDEFWTILVSIPMILLFASPMLDVVMCIGDYHQGLLAESVYSIMEHMKTFPEWYLSACGAAFSAAFGLRAFAKTSARNSKNKAP